VVGFDTTILPGREGSVTEEVSAKSLHGGSFQKYITVFSNAKNKPEMRLSIRGVVKQIIAAAPDYLQMRNPKDGKYELEVKILCEKADLSINEISFREETSPAAGAAAWQKNLGRPCTFRFTKVGDKPNGDGYYEYKLTLWSQALESQPYAYGEFVFKTNHPELPELKLRGMVDANGPQPPPKPVTSPPQPPPPSPAKK
jgi:hypothetical protein